MTNTTTNTDKARRDALAAIDLATRLVAAIDAAGTSPITERARAAIAIEAAELAWYATTIEETLGVDEGDDR